MVETITPVVYGGRTRWVAALTLHVVGATTTAALFGAALGAIGMVLEAPWGRAGMVALAVVAVVYTIGELPRVTAAVPQLRRQVPDWWRGFFSWPIAAALYGAGLGVGFFTFLSHGTLVVVAFAALVSGDPLFGAAVVGAFGLARGLSAARGARVRTQEDSQRLVDRLAALSERPRTIANGAVSAGIATLALVLGVRAADGWSSVATAALALAFGWAAASKAVGARAWRRTLAAHALPRRIETTATYAVPAAEALVPLLVVTGRTEIAGVWALTLLGVFTAEALRAWHRSGPQVPCGCFGGREAVAPQALLLRNAGLAAVAIVVALRQPPQPRLTWSVSPGPGDTLPMVLAVVGLAVAGFTAWGTTRGLSRGARSRVPHA
jgi:methylamine utilization protein MauE